MQGERRSLAGLARDGDRAAVLPDRTIGHGKPNLVPFPSPLVVKKGSKIRAPVFASIPTPVSATVATVSRPPCGRAQRAFVAGFIGIVFFWRRGERRCLRAGPLTGGKDWQY